MAARTFQSHNPVDGSVIDTHRIFTQKDVNNAVDTARDASEYWVGLGFAGRRKVLSQFSSLVIDRIDSIAALVSLETGKPISDAKLEVSLAAGHIAWSARNAARFLRTQSRSSGLLLANMSAKIEHSPLGVVGIIGPWNYPVFTPIGSIAYALAAGNTVVFKPSEYTPGVGNLLAALFHEASGRDDIFICITGLGDTGRFLCESGVNKVAFTGSTRTAKAVAAICAQTLTPVILECGGKDPVIVASDADLGRAADAAVWSAFSNAGQTCIGAERIYVHSSVAEKFSQMVVAKAQEIKAGDPHEGNYGPATMPSQIAIIEGHIKDALKRGGKALLGGKDSVQAPFVQPVVLADVPEDSTAMTEETFGPTIVINTFESIDEAIALANASRYGLGASVWSKKSGKKIASRLECGMVSVNSVIAFAGVHDLPFGGVKDSGYGRIHGREGLLEFTYPRSVVSTRFYLPLNFTSFSRTAKIDSLIVKMTKLVKGR